MGFPRQGSDAPQMPLHLDGQRGGEGGSEAALEVAADPTKQRGNDLERPLTSGEASLGSLLCSEMGIL